MHPCVRPAPRRSAPHSQPTAYRAWDTTHSRPPTAEAAVALASSASRNMEALTVHAAPPVHAAAPAADRDWTGAPLPELPSHSEQIDANPAAPPPILLHRVRLERRLDDSPRFPGDRIPSLTDHERDESPVKLVRKARPFASSSGSWEAAASTDTGEKPAGAEPEQPVAADREYYKAKWREEWERGQQLQRQVEALQAEAAEAHEQQRQMREEAHATSARSRLSPRRLSPRLSSRSSGAQAVRRSAAHSHELRRACASALTLKVSPPPPPPPPPPPKIHHLIHRRLHHLRLHLLHLFHLHLHLLHHRPPPLPLSRTPRRRRGARRRSATTGGSGPRRRRRPRGRWRGRRSSSSSSSRTRPATRMAGRRRR